RIESSTLTQTGAVLGTPSYMSPEQFMGQAVDARADLYCAGVLLYELLTGENPYVGQSVTAIMHKLLSSDPIDPTKLNLSLSETFDPLIRKALAKKPDERFQTAEEFKQALNLAAKEKQVSPADAEETLPPSISVPKPRLRWPMNKRLWLLAVAGALVLGAVFVTQPLIAPEPAMPTPPSAGLVNVISDPPGAKILLDGQFVGLTPKEIAKPAGEYAIVLQKAGYQDLRAKLMIEPSADVDFDVILSEAGGE
ncbi:MAG: protein kinase domain-containing protein, partial [Gammaproteobacteria bacterium]